MIIVSGRLYVRPGDRPAFLTRSAEALAQARRWPGCRDFVVAADPVEPDRVNVYEEWETEDALLAFRGDGPALDDREGELMPDVAHEEGAAGHRVVPEVHQRHHARRDEDHDGQVQRETPRRQRVRLQGAPERDGEDLEADHHRQREDGGRSLGQEGEASARRG